MAEFLVGIFGGICVSWCVFVAVTTRRWQAEINHKTRAIVRSLRDMMQPTNPHAVVAGAIHSSQHRLTDGTPSVCNALATDVLEALDAAGWKLERA
jgi:hypothetical protein